MSFTACGRVTLREEAELGEWSLTRPIVVRQSLHLTSLHLGELNATICDVTATSRIAACCTAACCTSTTIVIGTYRYNFIPSLPGGAQDTLTVLTTYRVIVPLLETTRLDTVPYIVDGIGAPSSRVGPHRIDRRKQGAPSSDNTRSTCRLTARLEKTPGGQAETTPRARLVSSKPSSVIRDTPVLGAQRT